MHAVTCSSPLGIVSSGVTGAASLKRISIRLAERTGVRCQSQLKIIVDNLFPMFKMLKLFKNISFIRNSDFYTGVLEKSSMVKVQKFVLEQVLRTRQTNKVQCITRLVVGSPEHPANLFVGPESFDPHNGIKVTLFLFWN